MILVHLQVFGSFLKGAHKFELNYFDYLHPKSTGHVCSNVGNVIVGANQIIFTFVSMCRLLEENNSDEGIEAIDWLELKSAVDKEQSLACTCKL